MRNLKRLNENIEWTMYNSSDADEHLRMIFTDFINPMDPKKKESKVSYKSSGRAVMMGWVLDIPFNQDSLSIDKYLIKVNDLLEELNSCIKKTKLDMPNIRHNIQIRELYVHLIIWNND
jgi:hypothetical protein